MASTSKALTDAELQAILNDLSDEDDVDIDSQVIEDINESDGVDSDASSNGTISSDNASNDDSTFTNLVAKSGRSYVLNPPRQSRRAPVNIISAPEGLTADGRTDDIVEAFRKFITPNIIQIIVLHTNEEADRANVPPTNETEMYALLGLLILMGANFDTNISPFDLWSDLLGKPIYKSTMSRSRFLELLKIIRFDDKTTREERRVTDKFAPLREVFQEINRLFPKYYVSGPHNTIDEMLCLFRGRCPFKVFMKDKPGKYGILIRMLANAQTRYVLKMEVYAGKDNQTPEDRSATEVVKRLVEPIKGKGYNLTTDRYYTSVELAEILYTQYRLTLVGTMKSNRKHIPEKLKQTKGRELYSSIFAFTNPHLKKPPVTLVSYITRVKPTRNLIMLSTQHQDIKTDNTEKKKTDINLYYNETKGGVDTVDQMARNYSVKRGTRRWPLSLFYSLVDIAALNTYTIFIGNNPEWNSGKPNKRKLFLIELGKNLIKPLVEQRSNNIHGLQISVILGMEAILGRNLRPDRRESATAQAAGTVGRARCHLCLAIKKTKQEKDRLSKSKVTCSRCRRHVCSKHSEKSVTCLEQCQNFEESD